MEQTIENAESETDQDLLADFERFNQPGYVFAPLRTGVFGWLMRHIWMVPLGILLVNLTLVVWAIVITINDPSDFNQDMTELMVFDSSVYLIPFFSIFLCAGIFYHLFVHRAPRLFYWVANAGSLLPGESPVGNPRRILPNSSFTYGRDLEKALQGRWGRIFVVVTMLICLFLTYRLADGRRSLEVLESGFSPLMAGEFFLIIIIPVFGSFLGANCLWTILVVGLYLRWLTPTFKLNIVPYHQDNCGGLKPVGDVALLMALIYLVPGILMGLWAFRGLLGESIEALGQLVYALLLLVIVLSIVSFILPVLRVHREMEWQRNEFYSRYLTEALRKSEQAKNHLRRLVASGQDQGPEAQALKYDLELLENLYPNRIVYRTWPFGYAAIAAFVVGQSVQFLPIIYGWVSNTVLNSIY